jgi:hypothetical protein
MEGFLKSTSLPFKKILPEPGLSRHPAMLSMVDFPDHGGPIKETNSPFSIS